MRASPSMLDLPAGHIASCAANIVYFRLFVSPEEPIITVKFSEHEIKVSKKVLEAGSDFFQAALNGSFQEARSGTITLDDDDPHAIYGMILWMHGFAYNGFSMECDCRFCASAPHFPPSIDSWPSIRSWPSIDPECHVRETKSDMANFVLYKINSVVAGEKYLVHGIKDGIVAKGATRHIFVKDWHSPMGPNKGVDGSLEWSLGMLQYHTNDTRAMEQLDLIVRHVYIHHVDAAAPLREIVARWAKKWMSIMCKNCDHDRKIFDSLIEDAPTLAWDMFHPE